MARSPRTLIWNPCTLHVGLYCYIAIIPVSGGRGRGGGGRIELPDLKFMENTLKSCHVSFTQIQGTRKCLKTGGSQDILFVRSVWMSIHHAVNNAHWMYGNTWVWVEVLRSVGIYGHLTGENIQSYNLFSPVMITWWMKLEGNLPPGRCPTLFYQRHGIFYMTSRKDTAGHTNQGLWLLSIHTTSH